MREREIGIGNEDMYQPFFLKRSSVIVKTRMAGAVTKAVLDIK